MKHALCLLAGTLLVLLVTTTSNAALVAFTEDFSGALGPGLQDSDSAFTIDGGVIRRTSSSDGEDRHYISTVHSGYSDIDFVAELTVNLANETGGADVAFIGVGPGAPDPGYHNEPGDAIYFRIHPLGLFNPAVTGSVQVGVNDSATAGLESGFTMGTITTNNGSHRVRITKSGNQVTFGFDENFSGTYSADFSHTIADITTAAPWLDPTNTRIFFGSERGADGHSYDDFSVIPEPSCTLLALLGLGVTGLRRRRS